MAHFSSSSQKKFGRLTRAEEALDKALRKDSKPENIEALAESVRASQIAFAKARLKASEPTTSLEALHQEQSTFRRNQETSLSEWMEMPLDELISKYLDH